MEKTYRLPLREVITSGIPLKAVLSALRCSLLVRNCTVKNSVALVAALLDGAASFLVAAGAGACLVSVAGAGLGRSGEATGAGTGLAVSVG